MGAATTFGALAILAALSAPQPALFDGVMPVGSLYLEDTDGTIDGHEVFRPTASCSGSGLGSMPIRFRVIDGVVSIQHADGDTATGPPSRVRSSTRTYVLRSVDGTRISGTLRYRSCAHTLTLLLNEEVAEGTAPRPATSSTAPVTADPTPATSTTQTGSSGFPILPVAVGVVIAGFIGSQFFTRWRRSGVIAPTDVAAATEKRDCSEFAAEVERARRHVQYRQRRLDEEEAEYDAASKVVFENVMEVVRLSEGEFGTNPQKGTPEYEARANLIKELAGGDEAEFRDRMDAYWSLDDAKRRLRDAEAKLKECLESGGTIPGVLDEIDEVPGPFV